MALLPIFTYGDPVLRRKSLPVADVDDRIRELAADMIETMYDAEGVGLAAPQVGHSIRMLVADGALYDLPEDAEEYDGSGARAFINPVIEESWDEWKFDEGCLSVPGIRAEIVRPEAIRLRYTDIEGQEHVEEFHGIWSRILQHEIDHLDGKLFVDYLSPMRRSLIMKKLKEIARDARARITV